MVKNKKKYTAVDMTFRSAVDETPDVKNGFCYGLQALKGNTQHVNVSDSRKLDGSVDIDDCTHDLYPNDSRWDYVLGYGGKAYFLEVHPANTSNVKEMINKAKWLTCWLNEKAPLLKSIAVNNIFYWAASGKSCIIPGSTQSRQLAQSKIQFVGKVLHIID